MPDVTPSFHDGFVDLFNAHFQRIYRVLDRLSGDAELASDLAQEAFIRLYRRGSLPDAPEAWLISVAMNLFRNERSSRTRRSATRSRPSATVARSSSTSRPASISCSDGKRVSSEQGARTEGTGMRANANRACGRHETMAYHHS